MPTILEQLQYGFDRDSRRTWRRRSLTSGEDNHYSYDGLSQIVGSSRGNLNLNQTAISAVPALAESWNYDPTGNWKGYSVQADGSVSLDQHRVHDKGNRLTQIEDSANPLLLDRSGRMTEMAPDASGNWDESLKVKWDAWSRITEVKRASDEAVLGSYSYDGLTRRTTRSVAGTTHHYYYSNAWRPLEERKDSQTTASAQYLWGERHRDDLVRRDRATTSGGSLDETRYVLMDYYSPAAITDETGSVKERYAFSAFGVRRILAPDFSPRSSSECAFEFGFQGQFLDTESGLLNYGYRYYSPFLGRWTCKDPIEELGGLNLYGMVDNNAVGGVDYLGLDKPGLDWTNGDPALKYAALDYCVKVLHVAHYSGDDGLAAYAYNHQRPTTNAGGPSGYGYVGCGANVLNQLQPQTGLGIDNMPINNEYDPKQEGASVGLDPYDYGSNLTIPERMGAAIAAAGASACKSNDCCVAKVRVICQDRLIKEGLWTGPDISSMCNRTHEIDCYP